MRLTAENLEIRVDRKPGQGPGSGKLIQRAVSFEVRNGTIFAVMGGSGAGKSTLLKCLVGLLRPAAGRVLYDGVDYWASDEATRAKLRAKVGMLFQSAALWSSMS